MKTLPPVHRIALLFNGSKIYDRGIIAGIGNYLSSTRASWDLFLEEDFLRWDSLGEFLALAVSLEDLGIKENNSRAKLLAKTLDEATGKLLDLDKSPSRRTGELDNRGSQFYIAMYWAQALAAQTDDKELAAKFAPIAKELTDNEAKIVGELKDVQGKAADIGGYYQPDVAKLDAVMRPSATFNKVVAEI